MPDLYEILQIAKDATPDQIKKAYRKAALKWHPDRNPNNPDAESKFKQATAAYEILSDPQKKAHYDRFGTTEQRQGGFTNWGIDFGDIFNSFFGSGGTPREQTIRVQITVSLEEVDSGANRAIHFQRNDICSTCNGIGGTGNICSVCGGYGQVTQQLNVFTHSVRTCYECKGTGTQVTKKCDNCNGQSFTTKDVALEVHIPAGIHNETTLEIPRQGHLTSRNGTRGKVHVLVKVAKHKLFHRRGNDLIYQQKITFTQACLGTTVDIPTLRGETVQLNIPKGTQFGQLFRIADKGLRVMDGVENRGHLFVEIKVVIPEMLAPGTEELLRRFEELQLGK